MWMIKQVNKQTDKQTDGWMNQNIFEPISNHLLQTLNAHIFFIKCKNAKIKKLF